MAQLSLHFLSGPDSGRVVGLPVGRHVLGAGQLIGVGDPLLQPHHVAFVVTAGDPIAARDGTTAPAVSMLQLSGRPATMQLVRSDPAVTGWVPVHVGDRVGLGSSTVELRRAADPADPADPAHPVKAAGGTQRSGIIRRPPRRSITPAAALDEQSGPTATALPNIVRDRPGGLGPTAVGLAGSAAVAIVVRQPMFLLFGAIGSLVALTSWAGQWWAARRRWRAAIAERSSLLADAEYRVTAARRDILRHLIESAQTPARARRAVEGITDELWTRRRHHDDAWMVTVGYGPVRWPSVLDATSRSHLHPHPHPPGSSVEGHDESVESTVAPAVIQLGPTSRTALTGPQQVVESVARSLIVQLTTACGPADVRVVLLSESPARLLAALGVGPIGHLALPSGRIAAVTQAELADTLTELRVDTHGAAQPDAHAGPGVGGHGIGIGIGIGIGTESEPPHVVVVTDSIDALTTRTGPLRRWMAKDPAVAIVALLDDGDTLPHVCTTHVQLTTRWTAQIHLDTSQPDLPQRVDACGMSLSTCAAIAAALRACVDPDDILAAAAAIPSDVDLATLLELRVDHVDHVDHVDQVALVAGVAGVVDRWSAAGDDPALRTRIGVAADGVVDIDLVRDGPHGLLAGTTGAGKSELLRSLIIGLAVAASPEHLAFVLIDYKGGAAFDDIAALPHVAAIVTDLDNGLADRALRSLHAELRRRELLLRQAGATDIAAYRRLRSSTDGLPLAPLARLVIVVDEFASLVAEQPSFLDALVGVAQRGRSLGVHLLLGTQRPAGVISDDIRANTNLRIALRLADVADALDVVGDPRPAHVTRHQAGRALVRLGEREMVVFQTALCRDAAAVSSLIAQAAGVAGLGRAAAPWSPPLPVQLSAADITGHPALGHPALGTCASTVLGLVDDPDRQRHYPLTWQPSAGHLAIIGGRGSGVSSTLERLISHVTHRHDVPDEVGTDDAPPTEVYVIDARGDGTAIARRCPGAVVLRGDDADRVRRTLRRLTDRIATGVTVPTLLLVDGIGPLRSSLSDLDRLVEDEEFDLVLARGPQFGITVVMAAEQCSEFSMRQLGACVDRWIFAGVDKDDLRTAASMATVHGPAGPGGGGHGLGGAVQVNAAALTPTVPGRCFVASSGLLAQIVSGPSLCAHATPIFRADEVETLPAVVNRHELMPSFADAIGCWLALGLDDRDLATASLHVPDGEHALVIGPSRSGRTTSLRRLANAWSEATRVDRSSDVVVLAPRRGAFDAHHAITRSPAAARARVEELLLAGAPRVLLIVDDADLVDDDDGWLARTAAPTIDGTITIIAAVKPDNLRQNYGHWTASLRRGRRGLILAACADSDGDLLGATLPHHGHGDGIGGHGSRPRPGLAFIVDNGDLQLVQVATGDDAPTGLQATVPQNAATRPGHRSGLSLSAGL